MTREIACKRSESGSLGDHGRLLASLATSLDAACWLDEHISPEEELSLTKLSQPQRREELQSYTATLLSHFHHLSEKLAVDASQITEEIVYAIPKAAFDLTDIWHKANQLDSSFCAAPSLKEPAQDKQGHVHALLPILNNLDLARKRLEESRAILAQAENWSLIETDINLAIQSNQWHEAADRLAEAGNSLAVFDEGLELAKRRELLHSLEAAVLQSLGSLWRSALETRDRVKGKEMVLIFEKLSRADDIYRLHASELSRTFPAVWNEMHVVEDGESEVLERDQRPLLRAFTSRYLDAMLASLNAEQPFVAAIYSDPCAALDFIVCVMIDSQSPTLEKRLHRVCVFHKQSALLELVAIWTKFTKALPRLRRIFTKLQPAQNQSFSIEMSQDFKWKERLLRPFLQYQESYELLERTLIDATIQKETFQWSMDDIDLYARRIWEDSVVCFGLLEDALERCHVFTGDAGLLGLPSLVDEAFVGFVSKVHDRLPAFGIHLERQMLRSSHKAQATLPTSGSGSLAFSDETRWDALSSVVKLLERLYSIMERFDSFYLRLTRQIKMRPSKLLALSSANGEDKDCWSFLVESQIVKVGRDTQDSAEPIDDTTYTSQAKSVLRKCALDVQKLIHTACVRAVMAHLDGYVAADVWTTSFNDERRRQQGAALDPSNMPDFASSPGPEITGLGELLLGLPAHLEGYCMYECMGAALDQLPHLPPEIAKGLSKARAPSLGARARKSSIAGRTVSIDSDIDGKDARSPDSAEPNIAPEAVMLTWVTSLALSVVHCLLHDYVLAIPKFSAAGSKQLAIDLSYLTNVLQAMDIDATNAAYSEISKVLEACEASDVSRETSYPEHDPIIVAIRSKLSLKTR